MNFASEEAAKSAVSSMDGVVSLIEAREFVMFFVIIDLHRS